MTMQRYDCSGTMCPVENPAPDTAQWVLFNTAQEELTAALDEGKAQYNRAEQLQESRDFYRHSASAALREIATLKESNAGLSSTISADVVAYQKLLAERDTLRDVLALLAPDLKTMAILYQQRGDHTRAQALMNICKSVGVE